MDIDTIPGRILDRAGTHDGVELVFDHRHHAVETTLGNLVTRAQRLAGALRAVGVGPGDVVAVQLGSTHEGAVVQTAVLLAGAVLLPVVLIYGPREMEFILRQSGAVVLVLQACVRDRDHAVRLLAELRRPSSLRSVVVVGERAPQGTIAYADLLRRSPGGLTTTEADPDARALLVYTSGTTAEPKGVLHSHRTLLAETDSQIMAREPHRMFRQLALFPAGHVAGLLGLLRILVHGTPTVVPEQWDAERAASLVDAHGLTYGIGAPVQLAGLLDAQERGIASLATLAEFTTGGAGVPPSLIVRADAAGVSAYRSYGSSEHPTISSGSRGDPQHERAATDGRVAPGNEVRIVDDDGDAVPVGAVGEIVSRGPELFLGYSDPAVDAGSFLTGGWFRTGDIGRLDDDGYLTVTDRKKDIIIRGGENISAKEVEDVLAEHPAVAEVAAIGLPDPLMGERVCAVVVVHPGQSLDLDGVREHFAATGLARQKTPERVEVLDSLPRTPAGKVQKFLVRERLSATPAARDARGRDGG